MRQYLVKILFVGLVSSGITACSSMDFSNRTIHQGNLNINSSASKLHNGMSKKSVANIMGTSLISPMFNNDRWDYTQTSQKPRQQIIIKSLSLYFKSNRLIKIEKNL